MGFINEACNRVFRNFQFLFSSRLIVLFQDDFFKVVNKYYNWELISANTFLLMGAKCQCPCDFVISCTPATLASLLFFRLVQHTPAFHPLPGCSFCLECSCLRSAWLTPFLPFTLSSNAIFPPRPSLITQQNGHPQYL